MKKAVTVIQHDGRDYIVPTKRDVECLAPGDIAPTIFGWAKVVSIAYRGTDITGRAYVGYYAEFGENAIISHSLKENELDRSLLATSGMTSAEVDAIERALTGCAYWERRKLHAA